MLYKLIKRASNIFNRALDFLSIVSGILLVFATLSVCLGIVSRYFLTRPIAWVTEICQYIILYIAFLVSAWVLRDEGHVKMDLILNRLPHKVQSGLNIVTSIICMTACLILTWYGAKVTWDLYITKAFTYTILEVPKFIIVWVIFFGSFLLFIQFIKRTLGYMKGLRRSGDGK